MFIVTTGQSQWQEHLNIHRWRNMIDSFVNVRSIIEHSFIDLLCRHIIHSVCSALAHVPEHIECNVMLDDNFIIIWTSDCFKSTSCMHYDTVESGMKQLNV